MNAERTETCGQLTDVARSVERSTLLAGHRSNSSNFEKQEAFELAHRVNERAVCCQCIDISKSGWIHPLVTDSRLALLPWTDHENQELTHAEIFVIVSDGLPDACDIPNQLWKMIRSGLKSIVVLPHTCIPQEKCWDLIHRGIDDIIVWAGIDAFMKFLEGKLNRWQKVNNILESPAIKNNLVGESKRWKMFLGSAVEASLFSSSNVLITGESGAGKELVSRLIHTLDGRDNKGKLVLVDCTTVVPELSGSEFFGHEKGSYTSAVGARDGAFALADNGTLFLDEISELPFVLQGELLRVIQEKTYKRVGSNQWKTTNFRLVCATNKDLKALIVQGKFREDLFYRISDVQLSIPSLHEHASDIGLLARHFLNQFFEDRNVKIVPEFDETVASFIASRKYQGNIRELRQLVRRIAMHWSGGNYISMGCIPMQDRPTPECQESGMKDTSRFEESIRQAVLSGDGLMNIKNMAASLAIKSAIEIEKGDKQKAADRLNITLRAVQQYVSKDQMTF